MGGFKEAWCEYYREMEGLAKRVMSAFAEALDLQPNFFDGYIKNPISALRALNYPATTEVTEEGQQRAGAHTDYGSLTILLPQPGTSGLQINQNGNWLDVPAEENCFIINLGDLMELWTSGRWVSTLHRVVARPHQAQRKSLAFFHQPCPSSDTISNIHATSWAVCSRNQNQLNDYNAVSSLGASCILVSSEIAAFIAAL